ncbi:hypothetical protein DB346_08960 [Verrucomicrobia bacterium LW23]|nr:hypothetical protein DB346_08960 [Verrucomicrobia bacterium LW23]
MRIQAIAAALLLSATTIYAEDNLVKNGNFEEPGAGWALNKATIEEESGAHFLRLKAPDEPTQVQAHQRITLSGDAKKLTLKFKVRYEDIQSGAEKWHDGRLIVHFKNAAGENTKPAPKPVAFRGSSSSWTEKTVELEVPDGSATVEILFGLFQAKSGTLDVDDVTLTP